MRRRSTMATRFVQSVRDEERRANDLILLMHSKCAATREEARQELLDLSSQEAETFDGLMQGAEHAALQRAFAARERLDNEHRFLWPVWAKQRFEEMMRLFQVRDGLAGTLDTDGERGDEMLESMDLWRYGCIATAVKRRILRAARDEMEAVY